MTVALALAVGVYLVIVFALSVLVGRKIRDEEDFIVAGRRLPFLLAMPTLLATWFGAGTLLVSADEVRAEGLRVTAMEPFGAGICLILAGLFFARALWDERVCTVVDVFRKRYGRVAEVLGSLYSFSFLGWIATQLIAVAKILELYFSLDPMWGVLLVAGVSLIYTLIGGMWSVTVTDAFQMALIAVGLVLLAWNLFASLGEGSITTGLRHTFEQVDEAHLVLVPRESAAELFRWLSLFIAGTLGILPGQDLMQRVFAARSSRVAFWACLASGTFYIVLGTVPVLLGLAGSLFDASEIGEPVIAALAQRFLSPSLRIVFIVTLLAAVMSSLDSAFLAPASILARNALGARLKARFSHLLMVRLAVVVVAIASVALALSGTRAFELLEGSYAVNLPPLVVLAFAIYRPGSRPLSAILTLVLGLAVWLAEGLVSVFREDLDLDERLGVPLPILVLLVSVVTFSVSEAILSRVSPRDPSP